MTTRRVLAGKRVAHVAIRVIGDKAYESDENLGLLVSHLTGTTQVGPSGVGTILNDDSGP